MVQKNGTSAPSKSTKPAAPPAQGSLALQPQQPKGIRLFELVDEYKAAARRLEELDLDEQTIEDTLEGMSGAIEAKAIGVAMVIKNLEATADSIATAIKGMQKRKTAMENRATALTEYLKFNLEASEIKEVTSDYFKIAVRENPVSVVVDDVNKIPDAYWVTPEVESVLQKQPLAAKLKEERDAIAAAVKAHDDAVANKAPAKTISLLFRAMRALEKTRTQGAHLESSGTRLDIH